MPRNGSVAGEAAIGCDRSAKMSLNFYAFGHKLKKVPVSGFFPVAKRSEITGKRFSSLPGYNPQRKTRTISSPAF